MGWRHDQRGNYVKVSRTGGQLHTVTGGAGGGSSKGIIRMRVDGLELLLSKLGALGVSIKPILRQSARKSATPIVKMARSLLPARGKRVKFDGKRVVEYGRTGQLRKSIASRVLTSRSGTIHAVIGARRKFITQAFKAYHKPNRNAKAQRNVMVRVRPTNYSHLIEQGFTAKLWGSGKMRPVAGRGFLRKSLSANYSEVQKITAQVLQQKIDQVMNSAQPVRDSA